MFRMCYYPRWGRWIFKLQSNKGETPLHASTRHRCAEVTIGLLCEGTGAGVLDDGGNFGIGLAGRHAHAAVVRISLEGDGAV